jgi:Tfp pilus assembly major pilin PilA
MHLRSLAPIVACLALLAVGACGGDAETTDTTTSTATSTDTTAAETTETDDVDTSGLPDAATLRDVFNEQLLKLLTTTQGLSEAQAQCAIHELDKRFTDEEIREAIAAAGETGQSPQELIDEAFDAGAQCADG